MTFQKSALALAITFSLGALSGCSDDDDKSSPAVNSVTSRSSQGASSSVAAVTMAFNRISTFAVCEQLDATCNVDDETVAEIVTASNDGNTLIYTDGVQQRLGFIDITDAAAPKKRGTVMLAGEPTSVAVVGNYAVAGVNTSADYINTSGGLAIIDMATQEVVRTLDLGGQPDSVAVSPDGKYIAVAIENERDEDLGDGIPPQLPAGFLMIVDVADTVDAWAARKVELVGLDDMLFPADPEPEFVSINSDNIAVVTLQENNHIAMVDLASGTVTASFSAGAVDLTNIDTTEEGELHFTESLDGVVREPDGVTWLGTEYFATANEGDMDGGSRGFSIFDKSGNVIWDAGNMLEHLAARFGHYPDARAENKGNEPENVAYGIYGETGYLFVNAERAGLVFVFDVTNPALPVFKQALPTGVGPEGALAIPSRNLVVVASENDARADKLRSSVTVYQLGDGIAQYPTIESVNRDNDTPIAWGALSGLAAGTEHTLYAIEDSYYNSNRIFTLDISTQPAKLTAKIMLIDSNDALANLPAADLAVDDIARAGVFDKHDLMAMINSDKSVNIDPEGIATASDGGFWLASEGAGTVGDDTRPIESLNLLMKVSAVGVIEKVITLPEAVNAMQLRFGFEGVTEADGKVYVAFQRAWGDETEVRIGVYDTAMESWSFVFYPLDAAASQAGGWVGLSDITAIGSGKFLVLERDNQSGFDAAIKRIYEIDLTSVVAGSTVTKTLVRDLMADLKKPKGMVPEKIEGLAVTSEGDVYIVNDNDGVDDNSGETQLMNLGKLLD